MQKRKVRITDRILAYLLVFAMLIGILPTNVFASAEGYDGFYTVTVQNQESKAPVEGAVVDYSITIGTGETQQIIHNELATEEEKSTDEKGVLAIDLSAYADVISEESPAKMSYTVTKDGYQVVSSTEDVDITSAVGDMEIDIPKLNNNMCTITADITGNVSVMFDGVEVTDVIYVEKNKPVEIKIIPKAQTRIKSLTIGEVSIPIKTARGDSYTVTRAFRGDSKIKVTAVDEYEVSVNKADGGTVTLNGSASNSIFAEKESTVELKVSADQNYQIASVLINGTAQTLTSLTDFSKVLTIREGVKVDVTFVKVYTVTVTYNQEYGMVETGIFENGVGTMETINPEGSITVETGKTVKIIADPADNYRVDDVLINGIADTSVDKSNYTPNQTYTKVLEEEFLAKQTNHEIKITFAPNTYTITTLGENHGTISLSDADGTVNYNDSVVATLSPEYRYTVEKVEVNGVEKSIQVSEKQELYIQIDHITENQVIQVTYIESASVDFDENVTFNGNATLRSDKSKNLYVYANDGKAEFKTSKMWIRFYDKNREEILKTAGANIIVNFDETTTIGGICVLSLEAGNSGWRWLEGIDCDNPLHIVIDEKLPDITEFEIRDASVSNVYGNDVYLDVEVEDPEDYSGLSYIKYTVQKEVEGSDDPVVTQEGTLYQYTDGDRIENKYGEDLAEIIVKAEENNSKAVTVNLEVADRAGNISKESKTFAINTKEPSLEIAFADQLPEGASGNNYQGRTALVTCVDEEYTFDEVAATNGIFNGILINGKEHEEWDSNEQQFITISQWNPTNVKGTYTAEVTFKGNAVYKLNDISYTNKAKKTTAEVNISGDHSLEFTVDNEAPKGKIGYKENFWSELFTILTFGFYESEEMEVKVIDESDNLSGVQEIAYWKSSGEELTEEITTDELVALLESKYDGQEFGTDAISVPKNESGEAADERFVVYARILDHAGNVTYLNTKGLIYDGTPCKIELTTDTTETGGFYTGDVSLSLSVEESGINCSGIKTISYRIMKGEKVLQKETTLFTFKEEKPTKDELVTVWPEDKESWTTTISSKKYNSDDINFVVTVVDNAGNETTEIKSLNIITDRPTVEISFDDVPVKVFESNDGKDRTYYQSDRKATICITDRSSAFDAKNVKIAYTATNAKGDTVEAAVNDIKNQIENLSWNHDGNRHTAEITFSEDANYTWDFEYTNKAGLTLKTITADEDEYPFAFIVDATAPTGSITESGNTWNELLNNLTFGWLFKKEKVNIEATATDATSKDISHEYYIDYISKDDVSETDILSKEELAGLGDQWNPWKGKMEIADQKAFVVYTKIEDGAGNVTYYSSKGLVYDTTGCTIFVPDKENLTEKIHNGDVEIEFNVTDSNAGIKSINYAVYTYTINEDGEHVPDREIQTPETPLFEANTGALKLYRDLSFEQTCVFTVLATKASNSSQVEALITVEDNAGNITTEKIPLDIDIDEPKISVTYDGPEAKNESFYPGERTATITIEERANHFDAKKVEIAYTATNAKGDTAESAVENIKKQIENLSWNHDGNRHTAEITFSEDANYSWTIDAIDLADNSAKQYTDAFTVDTMSPDGTIFVETDAAYKEEHPEWVANKSWSTLVSEQFTFRLWAKDSIDITAEVYDETIGAPASVKYYLYESTEYGPLSEETLKAISAEDWIPLDLDKGENILDDNGVLSKVFYNVYNTKEEDKKFVVYLRIEDKAGNYKFISTDGLIVDKKQPDAERIAPEIYLGTESADTEKQPVNGIYNSDVKVNVKVVDPEVNKIYSGLKEITYRVENRDDENNIIVTQSETALFTFAPENDSTQLQQEHESSIIIDSSKNNSNNVYVVIDAIDNAGNANTFELHVMIDKTEPKIHVTYQETPFFEGSKYFNKERTAVIVIEERNFDPNNTEFADYLTTSIEKDGSAIQPIFVESSWSKTEGTGNKDNTKWTRTIKYSADGDYIFGIACRDLAENPSIEENVDYGASVHPKEFTIDTIAPKVSVSYDNNSAQNGKYFARERVGTVSIVEHNMPTYDDTGKIVFTQTASLNGSGIGNPSPSWSQQGEDNHYARFSYSADGDYTFDVKVTDLAGNTCAEADYGGSSAGKDFTIDKTIVKPTIGGVENGQAYKDEVIPTIEFNDTNLASNEVRLYRTRRGEQRVDVTEQYIKGLSVGTQSGSGIFNTFEMIPENDGIYTLSVQITDKAGNTETNEMTFTVNRFGSVYVYDSYLGDLIKDGGKYVGKVDKDLIITEYNADKLVSGSLSIQITRDGKPLDKVKYEVSPVINDSVRPGESGWYQYQYTISKDNFLADGVYKIYVSSKDATGNAPENTNYDDMDIIFRVDDSKPEITSIVGLEESIINKSEVQVSFTVFDAIGLKSITIYVNGEPLEEITEFGDDINNYTGSFILKEAKDAQSVQIVVEDIKGNKTDTNAKDFESAYTFNKMVTISTDFLVLWYANQPLFWGSIIGMVAVAGILFFIILYKRKKDEEEKENA